MLRNSDIAELLSREAEKASHFVQKALRRAARLSFIWPEEAATLLAQKRSLTELPGIGPHLENILRGWIENPPPIPKVPDIRSGFLTLPQARAVLAKKPQWAKQLRGDLQMHTEWSDGSGTVREMAEAALARSYEYIAITDHTTGLKIAGGINEAELREQGREIAAINNQLLEAGKKLTVLRSTEMNLNPRGEGDKESDALAELDIVLGSFHSALRGKEDQTQRYLAALRNSDIQILGHPRGRIYNYRLGLSADWPRVFAEAAALDKAVEIDAYPDRQDLCVKLLKQARAAGCRISLGTDAHHPPQLGFIELGLAAALLARIPAERIINFMARGELLAWTATLKRTNRRFSPRSELQLQQSELISAQGDKGNMAKRELINTGTDKRFVRRGKNGTFKESDDTGRSLAADRRTKATTTAKSGQGDKGDRKVASKKKK